MTKIALYPNDTAVNVEKFFDDRDGLLELLHEAIVFLIAPGIAERQKLGVHRRKIAPNVAVEDLEAMGESAQLGRIDDGLRPATNSNEKGLMTSWQTGRTGASGMTPHS